VTEISDDGAVVEYVSDVVNVNADESWVLYTVSAVTVSTSRYEARIGAVHDTPGRPVLQPDFARRRIHSL
jgi:hypothetical protein